MKAINLSALVTAILLSSSINAAPVNINSASAKDIAESLSGIGINKAQAIVDYRKQHGAFKNAADILQVKGIGNSTFDKNKADILIK